MKKRPEQNAQDEKILSVVPPEFPKNGHLIAITGIPVLPYFAQGICSGATIYRRPACSHLPHALWKEILQKLSVNAFNDVKIAHFLCTVNT